MTKLLQIRYQIEFSIWVSGNLRVASEVTP